MPTRTASKGTRKKLPTFEVDKTGLAKLLERRGKEFVVAELVQNAWDEATTRVEIELLATDPGEYLLTVEDDSPEGFSDLSHAYTLFAESAKKSDPTKRGRFNIGEKTTIAVCREAEISTTKGRVRFDGEGREMLPRDRERGSRFAGVIRMDDATVERVATLVQSLIVPEGIETVYNGEVLPRREAVAELTASLRTEKADADGALRPTQRKTAVRVYEPLAGETAMLYEMGIPVVETGDRWHVDVGQKVPLNSDRDNVPPYYLRDVRAHVLNATVGLLDKIAASERWVTDALEDEKVDPDAVRGAVKARFGEKVVLADPSDREAERIATSKGYTVVTGGALPKGAWGNVRSAGAILPAGQVTPSPDPSKGDEELNVMDPDHWPSGVKFIAEYSKAVAREGLGVEVAVRVANSVKWPFAAAYGPRMRGAAGELTYNVGKLGFRFFDQGVTDRVNELLIHELAHHYSDNHLSREFYDACCKVGAVLARLMADDAFRARWAPAEGGVAPKGEVG